MSIEEQISEVEKLAAKVEKLVAGLREAYRNLVSFEKYMNELENIEREARECYISAVSKMVFFMERIEYDRRMGFLDAVEYNKLYSRLWKIVSEFEQNCTCKRKRR